MPDTYFATKGLFIRTLPGPRYIVQDVMGNATLPKPYRNWNELVQLTLEEFKISPLVPLEETHEFSSFTSFRWHELEHWYVAHLDYALNDYILGDKKDKFFQDVYFIPVAYIECGYGDGSRETLELIDKNFRKTLSEGKLPFDIHTLENWLVLEQFKRIFREITSLIQRSIVSFLDLLQLQRVCIQKAAPSLLHLKSNEVIHHGADAYRASTAATMSVISLCTSLDIQSKLIHYLDQLDKSVNKFKPAGARHFSDLRKSKFRKISNCIQSDFLADVDKNCSISELFQFRHDIVHSTSAIELEKIYVGYKTAEINEMPLHYSYQGWRDCTTTGQPERYLGRDYFVGCHTDIEIRIFSWIKDVTSLHIDSGSRIASYLRRELP